MSINFPPTPQTNDVWTNPDDGVVFVCEVGAVQDPDNPTDPFDPDNISWTRRGNAIGESVAIGALINFGGTTAPAGYLACDGGIYDKSTYPDLYDALGGATNPWNTTAGATAPADTANQFRIPPQNVGGLGLFMRGDGDSTVVGEYQADVFKEHIHVVDKTGAYAGSGGNPSPGGTGTQVSGTAGDPTETRPRSITTLLCIKATFSSFTGDLGNVPVNSIDTLQIVDGAVTPAKLAAPLSGRNLLINGDMSVWQRGTSFIGTGAVYTADSWRVSHSLSGSTYTVSRQEFGLGQTSERQNRPKYFLRLNDSPQVGENRQMQHRIESVLTGEGLEVTLSIWMREANGRTVSLTYQQRFGTGGSPSSSVSGSIATQVLTSSMTKYTYTFTLPSISGKTLGTDGNDNLQIQIILDDEGVSNQLDFTNVQLELGSVATEFEYVDPATQLARCQRYYFKDINSYYLPEGNGGAEVYPTAIRFPVTMRIAPTIESADLVNCTGTIGTSPYGFHNWLAPTGGSASISNIAVSAEL